MPGPRRGDRELSHVSPVIPALASSFQAPLSVSSLRFQVLSPEATLQQAEVSVTDPIIYEAFPEPKANGVLDRRLGLSDKGSECATCARDVNHCMGHFGVIHLALPIYHPGLLTEARGILASICKTCARVRLDGEELQKFRALTRRPSAGMLKACLQASRAHLRCPHCGAENGTVLRLAGFKIVHEITKKAEISAGRARRPPEFDYAARQSHQVAEAADRVQDVLDPVRALDLLRRIPVSDWPYLGITPPSPIFQPGSSQLGDAGPGLVGSPAYEMAGLFPIGTSPASLIMQELPVPPACIRPSVASADGQGTTEDDLTSQLSRLVTINNEIRQVLAAGALDQRKLFSKWDQLYSEACLFVTGQEPSSGGSSFGAKSIRGVIERLKGKYGRFRGNLTGKRVDFSARTVISPNPYLEMDQVEIPLLIAKNLTYPEIVNTRNIDFLRRLVRNGASTYPGANAVVHVFDFVTYHPLVKTASKTCKDDCTHFLREHEGELSDLVTQCLDTFNLNNIKVDNARLGRGIARIMAGYPKLAALAATFYINSSGGMSSSSVAKLSLGVPYSGAEAGEDIVDDYKGVLGGAGSASPAVQVAELAGAALAQAASGSAPPLREALGDTATAPTALVPTFNPLTRPPVSVGVGNTGYTSHHRDLPSSSACEAAARSLRPGDIVYRHVLNNDAVLFNRQPSLHRMSMMMWRAKVSHKRTMSFNPVDCAPLNADFDGDESNCHLLQTSEARSEASDLMCVVNNILSPRHGEGLIHLNQDFLTGAYELTAKSLFLKQTEFQRVVCLGYDAFGRDEFYRGIDTWARSIIDVGEASYYVGQVEPQQPAIIFPVALWTGKQAVTTVLQGSRFDNVKINLTRPDKTYKRDGPTAFGGLRAPLAGEAGPRFMSPRDDYVCIRNSVLLSGRLTKAFLGGSRSGLFPFLIHNYSSKKCAVRMIRLGKMAVRFLMNRGFTIGLEDVTPSPHVLEEKQAVIQDALQHSDDLLAQYEKGRLEAVPGCTVEETLESSLNGILSGAREACAQCALRELHFTNKPLIMSLCGSKGSPINIAQMIVILGQQSFAGQRAPDDFQTRPLPHFPHFSKDPYAKGFATNSFYSGLTPFEFFAHARAGRDGIIDSACKTADTGYLQRRLMKCLEDLGVGYDGTVRTTDKRIVEFKFGHDGVDPMMNEGGAGGACVDFAIMLEHVRQQRRASPDLQGDGAILSPEELQQVIQETAEAKFFGCSASDLERRQLADFTSHLIERYSRLYSAAMECEEGGAGLEEAMADAVKAEASVKAEQSANAEMAVRPRAKAAASLAEPPAHQLQHDAYGLTREDVSMFMREVRRKYMLLHVSPGTAVGSITAQSIGEPSTQMTLKAFHHAGLASMNVTQGVPRLKEIINGVENISTPIITVQITGTASLVAARNLKNQIEVTTLGNICRDIQEVYTPSDCYVACDVDMEVVSSMHLRDWQAALERSALRLIAPRHVKGKLTSAHISFTEGGVQFRPPSQDRLHLMYSLQMMKAMVADLPVSGIETCSRAVINQLGGAGSARGGADKARYGLLVEGTGLLDVMRTPGVDFANTTTNNVVEVLHTLGVEAARQTIVNEVRACMESHGMDVDGRHYNLVADLMCCQGRLLGITRYGLAGMKEDSVLMLSSFEKTAEFLYKAALGNRLDRVTGVSEAVILGKQMPLGTGCISLLAANEEDGRGSAPRAVPEGVAKALQASARVSLCAPTGAPGVGNASTVNKASKVAELGASVRPRRWIWQGGETSAKDIDLDAFWYGEDLPDGREIARAAAAQKRGRRAAHSSRGRGARPGAGGGPARPPGGK